MEILNDKNDTELIDTVLSIAEGRMSTRLEALKKEFEAL